MFPLIGVLFAIIINAIGLTLGISYYYITLPVSVVLLIEVLLIHFQAKALLAQKDSGRLKVLLYWSPCEIISLCLQFVGFVLD